MYPENLLNSFITSNNLWVESLGFSIYSVVSCANSDNLTFSLPISIPSISFSCLIAMARSSSNMSNKSGGSGHPCLVLLLRGKACSFPPWNMMVL